MILARNFTIQNFSSIETDLEFFFFLHLVHRVVMRPYYWMNPVHLRGRKMHYLIEIRLEVLRSLMQSRLMWRELAHPLFLVLIY